MRVNAHVIACIAAVTLAGWAVGARAEPVRQATLVNDSPQALHHFYISSSSSMEWPEDVLGEDVVAAGGSVVLDLDTPACVFDAKAVLADGTALWRYNFDVCADPVIRLSAFTPGGTDAERAARAAALAEAEARASQSQAESERASASAREAAQRAELERGLPVCPGDPRCKKN